MDIWLHALIRQACRSRLWNVSRYVLHTKLYTWGLLEGDTEERKGKATSQQTDIEYLSFSQIFSVPNPRGGVNENGVTIK